MKIYDAIYQLGKAVHDAGEHAPSSLAVKLKARAFDKLVEEIRAADGPKTNIPVRQDFISIAGVKVTRVDDK